MPIITSSNQITGTAQIGDGVIATADLADNAVTPAKIEAGADGEVLLTNGTDVEWGAPTNPPTQQVFTADGTWTKPAGLSAVIVECWGAGGGSGHQENISNEYLPGAGGGAYSRKRIAAASLGSTETVTVGVKGAAGAATGANGSNGEDSTFGAHMTAGGGVGGLGSDNVSTQADGSAGGTATGGDVNMPGEKGGPSFRNASGNSHGGGGGASPFGVRAPGQYGTDVVSAVAGIFPGGGAAGCGQGASSGAVAGAAGADGLVIVTEFY